MTEDSNNSKTKASSDEDFERFMSFIKKGNKLPSLRDPKNLQELVDTNPNVATAIHSAVVEEIEAQKAGKKKNVPWLKRFNRGPKT